MTASTIQGTWIFEGPGEDEKFGKYVYSSPMNRSCSKNILVRVNTPWPCSAYNNFVTPAYLESKLCIPHALEGVALLTDKLNGRDQVLGDYCLQLLVMHFEDPPQPFDNAEFIVQEVRNGPRIHGIVTEGERLPTESATTAASSFGIPVVRVGPWSGGAISEEFIATNKKAEFFTKTDRRWWFEGVLKRLVLDKFAVMTDTTLAAEVLTTVKAEAAKQSKTLALSTVLLPHSGMEGAPDDKETIVSMVETMISQGIRYLLGSLSRANQYSVLACELYKRNVHKVIQVIILGNDPKVGVFFSSNCTTVEMLQSVNDGGWLGVDDYIGYGGLEDYFINQATGEAGKLPASASFNLAGDPWQDHFPSFGTLSATAECADDEAGTNASKAFRAMLGRSGSESVSCQDVTFMGQSRDAVITWDVAKYCPISACAYNSLSAGCRMSCACTLGDPAGALEHPEGGPLCTSIKYMPNYQSPTSSYRAEHWRCEGKGCRELAYAPSRIAFMEPLYRLGEVLNGGDGFCSYKYSYTPTDPTGTSCFFRSIGYPDFSSWGMWYHQAEQADGVYAFVMAFECLERKGQLAEFIDSDYGDEAMRESLVDCMMNNVSFEGMSGRISFSYYQSPPPGHTGTRICQDDMMQDIRAGMLLPGDAIVYNRRFSRVSQFICDDWVYSAYAPGRSCDGTSVEYVLDQDNVEVYPLDSPSHCPPGEYPITIGEVGAVAGLRLDECRPCLPGTFKAGEGPDRCTPCPAGWSAPLPGQTFCTPCELGNRSADPADAVTLNRGYITQAFGASDCEFCEHGYDSDTGSSECAACAPGRYREVGVSPRELGVHCTACPAGRFQAQEGSSECEACPEGLSTPSTSSTSAAQCQCAAGSYRSAGGGCEACPDGMTCVVGSDEANFPAAGGALRGPFATHPYPETQESFYTTAEAPLAPYRCMRDDACPGGAPASCSGSLVGLTCANCPEGTFLKNGDCADCEGTASAAALTLFGLLFAFACITVMHVMTNWPAAKASMHVVVGGLVMGMAVNFVLTVGSFNTLSTIWVPPLSDMFEALAIFSFNFDGMRLSCVLNNNSYVVKYLFKLLVVPISFLMVVAGAALASRVPQLRAIANFNKPALLNSVGFVMSMFFISVGLASLEGFRCIENPNGKWTLMANTSVVCFEGGEHTTVMVLSLIAVLSCPLLFLALNLWVVCCYASLSQKYGVRFTSSVRFLTLRAEAKNLAFGFGWNCRGFAVSLLPVLAIGEYQIQVGLLMVTFICWLGVQTYFNCWRFAALNVVDPILGGCTVLLLFGFAMYGSGEQDMNDTSTGYFIIAIATLTLLSLISTAGYNFASHMVKKTRFSFFLTHHKADAALYARQLKMMLDAPGFAEPFLDVDNLSSLDQVAFSVEASSHHIVMLTRCVLERPWCALEVAVSYLNDVPTTVVQLDDNVVDLTPEYLDKVISSFSVEDWAIFTAHGITKEILAKSFDFIAQKPKVIYHLKSNDDALLDKCIRDTLGESAKKFRTPVFAVDHSKVVHIVYNTKEALQCSAAYIACKLFQQGNWDATLCRTDDAAFPSRFEDNKGVGVVFLSKGLAADPTAMGMIVAMRRADVRFVTVLSQESFWRPDSAFLDALQGGEGALQEAQMEELRRFAPGASLEEVAEALAPVYTQIALAFMPEKNVTFLREEFKIIEARAQGELEGKSLAMSGSLSRRSSGSSSRSGEKPIDSDDNNSKLVEPAAEGDDSKVVEPAAEAGAGSPPSMDI